MNEIIEQGLRQRGINPAEWTISDMQESPLPGTRRICGHRETLATEDGRQVVLIDMWSLMIQGHRPMWEGLQPSRYRINLPPLC